MLTKSPAIVISDCDCCDKTAIEVMMRNGMLMCQDCRDKEDAVISTTSRVDLLLEQSKSVDNSIQIKTDIFQAATVAAIELKGAIDHDDSIPADQKDYMMAKVSLERFQHLQKVIFEARQELLARENEMRAWQVQVQTFAGKLRAELREQFKTMNIEYAPKAPTSPKTATGKTRKSPAKMTDIKEMAAKYGVPAAGVAMVASAKNLSPEGAAKYLAEQMGIKK